MRTASAPPQRFVYFGDLQAHLGGIPQERIRLVPPPGEATEEDALRVKDRENRSCELIDGVLVEKDVASFESHLAIIVAHFIQIYLEEHDLGIVLGADGMLRLFPGQVRIPDVSFISWQRLPGDELPSEAIWSVAPELAVEVLSAGNTEEEMERKLQDYFQAGSKLVWYIDARARAVRVYTSPRKSVLLNENDTLDGKYSPASRSRSSAYLNGPLGDRERDDSLTE